MKILQVGNTDIYAQRFNGFLLNRSLRERGVGAELAVWTKGTDDPYTNLITEFKYKKIINKIISRSESLISLQSVFQPWSFFMPSKKYFKEADLIHYHLIHNPSPKYFSILSLPFLTRKKPSIWTIHDLWALTSHCLYPYDCKKWAGVCDTCPLPEIPIRIRSSNARRMWNIKKYSYDHSNLDLIVASKYMRDIVKRSPLLSKFELHLVPFGINLDIFRPVEDSIKFRRDFGIPDENIVIGFRATEQYKGLLYIKEMLHKLKSAKPVTLVTFTNIGEMNEFRDRYQVIDLGWIHNEPFLAKAYNALDIFLMPSTQEAFGLMAIEAMACGKPVVVFDGTSLPDVVYSKEGAGVVVPTRDSEALRDAVERLISNEKMRKEIGGKALQLAKSEYDFEVHVDRMIEVYKHVISKRKA